MREGSCEENFLSKILRFAVYNIVGSHNNERQVNMSESDMGSQISQNQSMPQGAYPQPLLGNVLIKSLDAKIYLFALLIMLVAFFGVVTVVQFGKWADQTGMRVDVLELKNKVAELEKAKSADEQTINSLTQSHNGLVKATEGMVNQLHARIGALENKAAEEVAKAEADKKAAEEAEKNKGWFGSKESKKK